MEPEASDADVGKPPPALERPETPRRLSAWFKDANANPGVVSMIRRARRALPGDPDFGDPLSMTGDGGPQAAARAADRLLRDRDAATREMSLAGFQVWQALTERVSRRPANSEVTIVFTDLVGFSEWSLQAGDAATLRLLRLVAAAIEPPLLDRGGHIVKRMGDGIMAVFPDPVVAVAAILAARDGVKTVDVDGYAPRMRFGLHTGRPQRIGADWLGVDVNIAARVMERATRGGIMISGPTLELLGPDQLEALGVTAKRVRRPIFTAKPSGVPADLAMFQLRSSRRDGAGVVEDEDDT
ncbi:adenylate/guanylate cyclase domain-containing protein [Mycolicibacterium mengxianglii]|uniref:adenylate/guanylate cyclase domain-containing protein n=1 Tax=Mycolicibacterium mengxianglii TaxID=2736649 RepID=UPI0018EF2082